MHWVVSDQLLVFFAGETPTRGQWINLRSVCSNVIAFQGGRNVRLRWVTIIGDVLAEKFFIFTGVDGGHELSPCNEVEEDIVVSLWVTVQARSCLYACTRVRTHHFPLGLCPAPNWGLNYDPLPYFAYTSFPGWLRPCCVCVWERWDKYITLRTVHKLIRVFSDSNPCFYDLI